MFLGFIDLLYVVKYFGIGYCKCNIYYKKLLNFN